jgi:hypothetical protein
VQLAIFLAERRRILPPHAQTRSQSSEEKKKIHHQDHDLSSITIRNTIPHSSLQAPPFNQAAPARRPPSHEDPFCGSAPSPPFQGTPLLPAASPREDALRYIAGAALQQRRTNRPATA